jgi:hypothetical protein
MFLGVLTRNLPSVPWLRLMGEGPKTLEIQVQPYCFQSRLIQSPTDIRAQVALRKVRSGFGERTIRVPSGSVQRSWTACGTYGAWHGRAVSSEQPERRRLGCVWLPRFKATSIFHCQPPTPGLRQTSSSPLQIHLTILLLTFQVLCNRHCGAGRQDSHGF